MSELIFYDLKQINSLSPSLATQLAREIGRRIVGQIYQPEKLIEDENALSEKYQVSRSVVRDAIKILVGKGLLEVRRGIGTWVRPRKEWVLLDDDVLAWHQSAPSADFLRQLMDFRLIFEPRASRWVAEKGTDQDFKSIQTALIRMEKEKGTAEDFIISDALFHRAILRATHNEFLSAIEGVVFSALLMSIRLTNSDPRDNEASIPFHRAVYEAIISKQGDHAEKVMEKLLGDTNQRLKSWMKKN